MKVFSFLLGLFLLVNPIVVISTEDDLTLDEQLDIYTSTRPTCITGFSWAKRYQELEQIGVQPLLMAERILDDPAYSEHFTTALYLKAAGGGYQKNAMRERYV